MAGLSPDEERNMLISKLTDPSITPSSDDAFRARVTGVAPPEGSGLLGRIEDSAGRIASHPAVQALAGGPAPALINYGARSLGLGTGLLPPPQAPGGAEQPPPPPGPFPNLPPAPMPDTTPQIAPAPTLSPGYGKQASTIGVGGGMPGAGSKLQADFGAAQQARIDDLEARKNLQNDLGKTQANRVEATTTLEMAEAARQQKAAEEQQRIDAEANTRMQAYLDQNTKMANEIASMKTDPSRLLRSQDAATKFSMAIGAVAGGMLSALNGGPNQFMEQVNRAVDQDIQSQLNQIDNKRTALSQRNTIFGQMLQQTGDARMAAKEYRSAMYQAAQTALKARSDALGIPEITANSNLAANAIQQERDKLDEEIKARRLQMYQQQAAAAASAQRQAEERAWQRSMQVAELGLKKDELIVKAGQAKGNQQDQLKELAKDLANPEMIQNKVAVENAYQRLVDPKTGQIDPNKGLPGIGPLADFRQKLAGNPGDLRHYTPLGLFSLGNDERVSRQDWNQLKLGYRHLITGSGGGEKELEDIQSAFEGANTPQEQANAVKKLRDTVYRLEETKKAGYDPEVRAELERRLGATGAAGMPSTVRVKR